MTRRDMLKKCAAAAALQAFASTGFARAASASAGRPGRLWINKHRNLSTRVNQYFDVWNEPTTAGESWRTGAAALRRILDDAQATGRRVRAAGARWSLSPVAVCPDVMINTQPLNYRAIGLPGRHVSSSHADPAHLVFAQCGTSVAEFSARGAMAWPAARASRMTRRCSRRHA